jgi:hypothetical protein
MAAGAPLLKACGKFANARFTAGASAVLRLCGIAVGCVAEAAQYLM